MNLNKFYFLHGFAGDPEDWDEVISHLKQFNCIKLSYPFTLPTDGVLIGYSMGGRVTLPSSLPKIVISGHPGLRTEEEKIARKASEQLWIQKLKTVSITQFFDEWYAQPLFDSLKKHPSFPLILERRIKKSPELLIQQIESHSLRNQPTLFKNTIFLHGEYDTVYKDLYKQHKIPSLEIPKSGHACHVENSVDTAYQIKNLIGIFYNKQF